MLHLLDFLPCQRSRLRDCRFPKPLIINFSAIHISSPDCKLADKPQIYHPSLFELLVRKLYVPLNNKALSFASVAFETHLCNLNFDKTEGDFPV